MTLQDRLQELSNIVYQHGQATRTPIPFHYGEPMKDATKAIEQDLMELIDVIETTYLSANEALEELRQKLQDYLGNDKIE